MSSIETSFTGEGKAPIRVIRGRPPHVEIERSPKYDRPARFIAAIQVINVCAFCLVVLAAAADIVTSTDFARQSVILLVRVAIAAVCCSLVHALLSGVLAIFDIAHDANAVRRMVAEKRRNHL